MGLAIVTGGSRGIGAAIAEKLAQDGHDVLINCASSVEKAEAVAEKCRAYGVQAYVKQWDVADYDACAAALKEIKAEIGVPYILVNNAGITRDGLMIRMKEDQFDAVIRTNLKGAFNMLSQCGAMMMRAKQGRIINISLGFCFHGQLRSDQLHRSQGRHGRHDQDRRQGTRRTRHHGQRGRSGLDRDRNERQGT